MVFVFSRPLIYSFCVFPFISNFRILELEDFRGLQNNLRRCGCRFSYAPCLND